MTDRLAHTGEAGIAIGPILFVIAVLGILAAAISAGSGSFNASSTSESNRTKAAAIIEIGQNLKIGFDRIIESSGIDFPNVVIGVNNTAAATDLFSPTGGGVGIPAITMAATPSDDIWHYPEGAPRYVGTGANPDQLAVLNVSNGVCQEINNKIMGNPTPSGSTSGTGVDLGAFTTADRSVLANIASNWPAAFNGKPNGCVYNSNGNAFGNPSGWFFYQVIGIQ